MNWEAIGAIGEVAGAIGVVASLFYLAFQIRVNNKALRSNKYQDLISEFRNAWLEGSNRPEDIEILIKADKEGIDSLTNSEQRRWTALMFSYLTTFENAFHADREGVADPELWESARKGLKEMIARETNVQQLLESTTSFTRSFREEVKAIIKSVEDDR